MTRFKIQVNYKSGQSVVLDGVTKFRVTVKGDVRSFDWEIDSKGKMVPLFFNADEVESVWELR